MKNSKLLLQSSKNRLETIYENWELVVPKSLTYPATLPDPAPEPSPPASDCFTFIIFYKENKTAMLSLTYRRFLLLFLFFLHKNNQRNSFKRETESTF